MAVTYKTVPGRYLECWTAGYPRWTEVQFGLSIRSGDQSYRQATPKRKRSKPFIQDVFRPTAHYCDSQLYVDAANKVFSRNVPVSCEGTYWTPNGYVVQSAGATRRWADVSMWSGNPIPANDLTTYPSFNPSYNKLWDEVKSEKVNLAMMLAEYRQSANMFSDLIKELVGLYRSIRRGRFRQFVGNRNGPQNDWLMYRYGITPLISDINGISDLVMSSGVQQPLLRRVKVAHRSDTLVRGSHTPTSNYASNLEPQPYHWKTSQRVRDVVYLEYEQKNLILLSQTGFLNPLALGWELIPYSFVMDWFFDIGAQLSALDALTGVKRWAGTRAVVQTRNLVYENSLWGARAKRYNRTVITTGPALSLPRWDPSPTWKRFVDSIALGRQRMR